VVGGKKKYIDIFASFTEPFNYNLNSNHTQYLAQLCCRFLCYGKFPPQICKYSGATYRRNYKTFSAL